LLTGYLAADDEAVERWKTWRADLDALYEKIEEPVSLREIFHVKGIDWGTVKKEADSRFSRLASAAKKRQAEDRRADEIEFYGLLRYVVSQLRDSHASIQVEEELAKTWEEVQPRSFDAGIELLPGTHGTIIVANVSAARNSSSPLAAKGVRHEATILESVNGIPAAKYFAEKARAKYEEQGGQSTRGRAFVEALNDLSMPEDGSLELVFQTLNASDDDRERYLALDPGKREKAFARLGWKETRTSLRSTECQNTRNPRNFVFMALELPDLHESVDQGVRYVRLPSGYGYVSYHSVSGTSRQALEGACQELGDCPGLVLDMRWNSGGGDSGIGAFDATEGAWKKPVAVLIGPKAMSAAETELWALLQMREKKRCNARLFGRTTAGASGTRSISSSLVSPSCASSTAIGTAGEARSRVQESSRTKWWTKTSSSCPDIDSCIRRAEEWLARQ
jgi:C-terminal processing protease CtpA/Prc